MSLAIHVWLYECCSNAPRKIAMKVVLKNIESTQKELAKFQILEKDVLEDERSVDSDDDFQDPPPKQINEHSKKKQKVDSSTPAVKKSLRKKSHNIINKHTQKMTPVPRAAKGCTDLQPDKINVETDSQYLIPDELLRSINLNYIHSEKVVQHDGRISDEKMDETNLSDSQFTIPDEMLSSLHAFRRESITTHSSKIHAEEPTDENLNDKKSEFVV
ncbi:hypothetical protein FXO38_29678 [Capsicum annuum]|nr:hypothetical protein FXO38_29678 [Capsicum annuum]